ncbi:MAG: hypothetical protein GF347_03040, partial [Candidatus Moranbacteria bacterium]|nr:hypothetical protein [Candidatus Moranbacteria bacterium]
MKTFLISVLVLLASASNFSLVEEQLVVSEEAKKIQVLVKEVERAVNEADAQKMIDLTSREAANNLKENLVKALYGTRLEFKLEIDSDTFKAVNEEKVEVKGSFNVKGLDYEKKNVETFFVFGKDGEKWKIVDTDFHEKMREKNYLFLALKYFIPIFILSTILFGFWALILYDVVKEPLK